MLQLNINQYIKGRLQRQFGLGRRNATGAYDDKVVAPFIANEERDG